MIRKKIKAIINNRKTQSYMRQLGLYSCAHNTKLDGLLPSLIKIGKDFVSAPGSRIITHDSSLLKSQSILVYGKVEIGNDVFLGANSVVLYDTKIGNNSIVAAGAVVKGYFPDYSIIAGVPAKRIGDTRELISKIKERGTYLDVSKIEINLETKLTYDNKRKIENLLREDKK